jgi:hypothetical protein
MSSSIQLQIGYLVIPHSTKLPLFFPLKISTRYPQFEDSAGIGKILSLLKTQRPPSYWDKAVWLKGVRLPGRARG